MRGGLSYRELRTARSQRAGTAGRASPASWRNASNRYAVSRRQACGAVGRVARATPALARINRCRSAWWKSGRTTPATRTRSTSTSEASKGALVLGREQANGRLGRKRVALPIAGVGPFECTLSNDAAAPSADRRDRAPHRGQRPSAAAPAVPASRRPASHVFPITLPQADDSASKRSVCSVTLRGTHWTTQTGNQLANRLPEKR